MAKPSPTIGRIPAEIHAQAASMGLIVETYTELMAGHGTTGRVAWAVSRINFQDGWTDAVRLRYGTDSSHEHARASLRHALDEIHAALASSGKVSQ